MIDPKRRIELGDYPAADLGELLFGLCLAQTEEEWAAIEQRLQAWMTRLQDALAPLVAAIQEEESGG